MLLKGQKLASSTACSEVADVQDWSFATELGCPRHVRFPPDSDRIADIAGGPFRAKPGHASRCRAIAAGRSKARQFLSIQFEPDRFDDGPVVVSRPRQYIGRAAYLWIAKT